jgi:uncharacterized protein with HEPN domain
VTPEPPPVSSSGTAEPFTSRERPADAGFTEVERVASLLADMARLFDSAERIAARGFDAFTDPADDTQRLATETILIRLAEIGSRLPESFRSAHPKTGWKALRAIRNRVSHDYRSVDAIIIWAVIEGRLPEFRQAVGI